MAFENLDEFVKGLEELDLLGKEKEKVIDALRIIYIGQEKEGTIGIPHGDVDTLYEGETSTLLDQDMIYTVDHTGIWDFGYRCSEKGNLVGSEIMKKALGVNEDEIRAFLERFPSSLLSYWFNYAFEKTNTGHLSSRVPMRSFKWIVQNVLDSIDVLNAAERIRKGLVSLEVGVNSFDGKVTVLAPEFADFFERYLVDISEGMNSYAVYQTLMDFTDRKGFSSRDELLERLERQGYNEDQLEELINATAELGITSAYLRERITGDEDEEDDEEEADEEIKVLKEEILSERRISFVEDRPFTVHDRDGFDAYLKEVLLEPFKEALSEGLGKAE